MFDLKIYCIGCTHNLKELNDENIKDFMTWIDSEDKCTWKIHFENRKKIFAIRKENITAYEIIECN